MGALARSAEDFATAEQAHSDSDPADCSVELTADDWTQADRWAVLWADDSIRADCSVELTADGWAQADRWVVLWVDDSIPADCSVELTADGRAQADRWAALWADDSIPAGSVPHDWAQVGYSVGLTPDDSVPLGSSPADYSALAGRDARCFLDARPGYSPLAERRLDSVEDCKEPLPLWPV